MFIATSGPAIDWLAPTARNSNRLPVKANGLVRLRSPASFGSGGSTSTPTVSVPALQRRLRAALLDLLEHVGELIAEEDRDDRRRGFVRTQAMIVAGRGHDGPQQALVLVHGANHGRAEHQELRVVVRRVARIEQVALRRAAQRPVHVLARAVDAGERLLVHQARHAVLLGHALQRDHDQLLMVGGEVGVLVDRGDFVLGRGHFVVPRLDRNAELEQLALDFEHEGQHALRNRAEVVIFELLALRRLGAEQRAAGVEQVGPGEEEVAVDQEVFLLGAGGRRDKRAVRLAEQLQDPLGLRR